MITHSDTQQFHLNGKQISIRPISPGDYSLEANFIRHLSPQSKHFRFLGGIGELSSETLKQLCTVDGNESMAFIAVVSEQGKEVEIGVSRYAPTKSQGISELAITLADDWQHKGLGEILLQQLFSYAKEHGVKELYTLEDAENVDMHQLAHAIGMTTHKDPLDVHQVIYRKSLY